MSSRIVCKSKSEIFFEGDELEYIGHIKGPRGKIMKAFYSVRHTLGYQNSGIVTVRFDDYDYTPDDCHSFPARDLVKHHKEQPYDPTQMGDTEDDI